MLDLAALRAALAQGPVARVVIAHHDGSSPREAGASMLVTPTQTHGTIGGGALEHRAIQVARALLGTAQRPAPSPPGAPDQVPEALASFGPGPRIDRIPLGPALGQCCGGAVTLVTEVFTAAPEGPLHAIPLDDRPLPLAVKRLLANARAQGTLPPTQILQGWLVDPITPPQTPLWIWGAGHVGRAIAATLAPLPELGITWIDIARDRFPDPLPAGVNALPTPDPATAVPLAPTDAHHLVLTFSHQLDLELCHRLLAHGFASCGLIGSKTKWARFQGRLRALGQDPSPITCPIGDPALGKHPQAIAIGVAHQLMRALSLAPSSLHKYSRGGPGV